MKVTSDHAEANKDELIESSELGQRAVKLLHEYQRIVSSLSSSEPHLDKWRTETERLISQCNRTIVERKLGFTQKLRIAVTASLLDGSVVAVSILSALTATSSASTTSKAVFALDLLAALVPKRINMEEIGDALEFIHRMQEQRKPKLLVVLKVATTFWWVLLHTVLHCLERASGIMRTWAGLGSGRSDTKP